MKNERRNRILEILTQENKVDVVSLSERLGVSQVTIRKDLDELVERGIVKREHGHASLRSKDDINGRLAYHYEKKKKIASLAASLVSDGDCIMIESGSCCALLAEALTMTCKNLTIITNSAFIADYIRGKSNFGIVLLGGNYQQDAQVMVGPMVRLCAENYYAKYFFIGTDGYSDKTGFTNSDKDRAQAVRDMARQAEKIAVITESEKFTALGNVPLNLKNSDICLITDNEIPARLKQRLLKKGIISIITK